MKNHFNYIILVFFTSVMLSCVPQRKLEEEQAKRAQ